MKKKSELDQFVSFLAGYATSSLLSSSKQKTEDEQAEVLMKRLVERLAQNPNGKKEQEVINEIQKRAKRAKQKRHFWLWFWGIIILLILLGGK